MLDSDPIPLFVSLLLVLLLVVINGLFVAAECAILKVRRSQIDIKTDSGDFRAKLAKQIINNLNAYLYASQLGITIASLVIGWIGEPAVAALLRPLFELLHLPSYLLHPTAFIAALIVLATFHVAISTQYPKMLAAHKAEKVIIVLAAPMYVFYKLMYPLIWPMNSLSKWLLHKSGIRTEEEYDSMHSEDAFRNRIHHSHKDSTSKHAEFTLLDNIIEFTETNAREIMIPRTEMVCLYANLTYEENKQISVQEMRTRYPVCDPDKDNIIGFVHIKDLMQNEGMHANLRSLVRPVLSVPESIQISSLLQLMQKKKTKIALLIDEYGGTSGLVTAEDILEEIVGEIQSEFNEERPSIELIENGVYSVDGLMLIDQINELLNININTDNYDTIGGWMYSQVEIPPRANQIVAFQQFEFIIEEVDHLRVSRILIRLIQSAPYFTVNEEVS